MQWFFGRDGKPEGPVSTAELKALIAAGKLPEGTLAWREGMPDWLPLSQVPDLAPPPGSVPPPRPQQAPGVSPAPSRRPVRKRPWPLTVLALLWLLTGVVLGLGGVALGIFVPTIEGGPPPMLIGAGVALVGFAYLLTGLGVWMLKGWGRVLGILLAIPCLAGVPLGTIFAILLIVYLCSAGVKHLFSQQPIEDMDPGQQAELAAVGSSGLGIAVGVLLLVSVGASVLILPIAAIAIPNLQNAIQRGKQKRTMGEIRTVATAIESYAIDNEAYPDVTGDAEELRPFLEPTYILNLPATDGWNNPLVYEIYEDGQGYWIGSLGSDGVSSGPEEGPTSRFTDDIFMANGVFVTYPDGTQM
jgi:type II secretory pathway pseudopilin PulG